MCVHRTVLFAEACCHCIVDKCSTCDAYDTCDDWWCTVASDLAIG